MNKLFLDEPCIAYQKSFESYVRTYRSGPDPHYFAMYRAALTDFSGYLRALEKLAAGTDLQPDNVQTRTYWLIDDGEVVGVARIRPQGDPFGGHIGYDISPTRRGKGYGSAILALALQKAAQLGNGEVILTINPENTISRHIVQKHGGVLLGELYDPEEDEHLLAFRITL